MGYFLTAQAIDTTAVSTVVDRSYVGSKNRIGAPFLHTILSTKYWDADTKILAYQLRDYSPGMGRWLARDPVGEQGEVSLYAFIRNAPCNLTDYLGLKICAIYVWVGHRSMPIYGVEASINRFKDQSDSDCVKHAAYGCNLGNFLNYTEPYIIEGQPQINVYIGGGNYALNQDGNWFMKPPYDTSPLVKAYNNPERSWEDFSTTVLRAVLGAASTAGINMAANLSRNKSLRCKCDCDEVKLVIKKLFMAGLSNKDEALLREYSDQSWKVIPQ